MLSIKTDCQRVRYEDRVEREMRSIRMGSLKLLRTIQVQHPERFPKPEPNPEPLPDLPKLPSAKAIILRLNFLSFGNGLMKAVAESYSITVDDITGPSRLAHLVHARALIAGTLHARGWSYPQIGNLMQRDHSSIINLVSKIDIYRRRSMAFNEVWKYLKPYRNEQ